MLLHHHNTGNFMFYPYELFITLKDLFQNDAIVPRCIQKCYLFFFLKHKQDQLKWPEKCIFSQSETHNFQNFQGNISLGPRGVLPVKKVQGCSCQTYGYDPRIWVPISRFLQVPLPDSIFTFGKLQK